MKAKQAQDRLSSCFNDLSQSDVQVRMNVGSGLDDIVCETCLPALVL
jgi:hypothetical protein